MECTTTIHTVSCGKVNSLPESLIETKQVIVTKWRSLFLSKLVLFLEDESFSYFGVISPLDLKAAPGTEDTFTRTISYYT